VPTALPSALPSALPTPAPTGSPRPSPLPTSLPTGLPTLKPTPVPTSTNNPTARPTFPPTFVPTDLPTLPPSSAPTPLPTPVPTKPGTVKAEVAFKMYVNLNVGGGTGAGPTAAQRAQLKAQIANLTGVPAASMYGFSVVLDAGDAPTPPPTFAPTPLPTPVPTGICGCPAQYQAAFAVDTLDCARATPETETITTGGNKYKCCLYCCIRLGNGECDIDPASYSRRLTALGEVEEDVEEEEEGEGLRHLALAAAPVVRHLKAYYWDVRYTVIVTPDDTAYEPLTLTPTLLAANIVSSLTAAGQAGTFVVANATSAGPDPATLGAIEGITRSPTPQPSSPAPTNQPTHLPSVSVVPSLPPTMSPIVSPTPRPSGKPTHAPTLDHINLSEDRYSPRTSILLRFGLLLVPLGVVFLGLVGSLCCRSPPKCCWCCFPTEVDAGLVMFSNFAGGGVGAKGAAVVDEQYVTQHRKGGIYTWSKQFHARMMVNATPTGLGLAGALRDVERAQLLAGGEAGGGGGDDGLVDFTEAVDRGDVIGARGFSGALDPGTTPEQKLAALERIAVDMARKQQELVNALEASEEKHKALEAEVSTLRVRGKTPTIKAIHDDTEALGRGAHSRFLADWVAGGALVDAHLVEPPTPAPDFVPPEEWGVQEKLKEQAKAKRKAEKAARMEELRVRLEAEEAALRAAEEEGRAFAPAQLVSSQLTPFDLRGSADDDRGGSGGASAAGSQAGRAAQRPSNRSEASSVGGQQPQQLERAEDGGGGGVLGSMGSMGSMAGSVQASMDPAAWVAGLDALGFSPTAAGDPASGAAAVPQAKAKRGGNNGI